MWVRDFHARRPAAGRRPCRSTTSARATSWPTSQAAVAARRPPRGRAGPRIAESNQNDVRLVAPPGRGGYGLDGVWSDDFHHACTPCLTGERDGYYQDFGRPEHLAKASTTCSSTTAATAPSAAAATAAAWARPTARGSSSASRTTTRWETGPRGDRLGTIVPPAAKRLAVRPAVALALRAAVVHGRGIRRSSGRFRSSPRSAIRRMIEAVRRGRREEFAALAFQWKSEIPDPQDPGTFAGGKLAWAWPDGSPQAQRRQLYAGPAGRRGADGRHSATGSTPRRLAVAPATIATSAPCWRLQRGGAGGNPGRGEPHAETVCTAESAPKSGRPRERRAPGRVEPRQRPRPALEHGIGPPTAAMRVDAAPRHGFLPYELLVFGARGSRAMSDVSDWWAEQVADAVAERGRQPYLPAHGHLPPAVRRRAR